MDEDENNPTSPMLLACEGGHLEIAKFLVERGVSVFATEMLYMRFQRSSTLLAVCESTCDLKFVRWFIENGASIDGIPLQSNTPVIAAVRKGALPVVRYLIGAGADVNTVPLSNANAIYEAALYGELEILQFFVENHHWGCNEDGRKLNLLIGAARGGHPQDAKYLLQHKEVCEQSHVNASLPAAVETEDVKLSRLLISHCTDVNVSDENGNTAMCFAIEAGMVEIVELLLDRGADVIGPVNRYGYTAVEMMAEFGRTTMLRLVLQKFGAEIEFRDAFFVAADSGCKEAVLFLLDEAFPADFNVDVETGGGNTALMLVAQCGCAEILELLVRRGAKVNKTPENGRTAVIYAALEGHLEVVQRLCELGAHVEHADDWNTTALVAACEGGHLRIVEYLLEERQASTQVTTVNGFTCFTFAIQRRRADIIRGLLVHGANAHGVQGQRASPVLEAVLVGDLEALELLIQSDTDLNEVWKLLPDGGDEELEISPLIVAAGAGDLKLVKLLVENGAEVELITSMGESAFSFAVARGHLDVVKYLVKEHADTESKNRFGLCSAEIAHVSQSGALLKYLQSLGGGYLAKRYPSNHLQLSFHTQGTWTPELEEYRTRHHVYDILFNKPEGFEFTRV